MVTQLRQSSSLSNVLYNTGERAKSSQWPLMLSNGSYIDTVSDLTQVLANGNNALWNVWKANTCFSAICRNNTVLVTDKIKQNPFLKTINMNASDDFIYSGVHQRRSCFLHSGKITASPVFPDLKTIQLCWVWKVSDFELRWRNTTGTASNYRSLWAASDHSASKCS